MLTAWCLWRRWPLLSRTRWLAVRRGGAPSCDATQRNPVIDQMQTAIQFPRPDATGEKTGRDALLVRIGREYVAVWLDAVVSQMEQLEVRPLPDWRAGVAGLIRDGERFVPLYRPEAALGIARDDGSVERAAIVLRSGETCIALAIDEALDVVTISAGSMRLPPPAIAEDGVVQALTWSEGMLVSVLDPRALMASCLTAGAEHSAERGK